jgi:radical SAM superfamily enzyme YgiQ (UPF0313 family)
MIGAFASGGTRAARSYVIALVNHPGLKVARGLQLQTPSPPIGLAYLGGALRERGIDYVAVDACGEALDQIRPYPRLSDTWVQGLSVDAVVRRIPLDTRIVGFSCLFSHCWPLVTDLAAALRERLPDALFVAGGEHPSAIPDAVLRDGRFDVVVHGEGEETLLELVERVNDGKPWRDVAGIAWRRADGALVRTAPRARVRAIDDLPHPDWDRWCIESYVAAGQVTGVHLGRSMPILGSRGCPYACTFCSNEQMWTRRWIMRDPVRLVDEMELMKRRYDVTGFTFMDSTFVVNRKQTLAFCRELIRRDLGVTYQLPAGTRCEAFDDELARALEASGLRNFAFAPESGSAAVRRAIRKQIDLDRFLAAVRAVLRTRMTVGCFFVVGFPPETPATLRETLALVRRLALMGVHDVTVSTFTPYPGSADFDALVERGELAVDFRDLDRVIDFFAPKDRSFAPALSARQLHRWMLWAFVNFYAISFLVRPWRVLRSLWLYATQGIERARWVRFVSELVVRRRSWKRRALAAAAAPNPAPSAEADTP